MVRCASEESVVVDRLQAVLIIGHQKESGDAWGRRGL